MAFIPDDVINQVLERTDIVEVISGYIPLKQAGRNFKGLCPFHNEKSPSFVVAADKQIFHCFGCHAGGNVLKFVMLQERMEFPEAVRFLADKVNVMIPEESSGDRQKVQISQQLFDVNAQTAQYFHEVLLKDNSPDVVQARDYLKARGINLDMVKTFQIGYALDRWDDLMKYLRGKGVGLKLMEQAGLISPRRSGDGFYDRFRSRVMFPIFDYRGRCVAFGGRTLSNDAAKYMNSPDTPVYLKGRHLYGFHLSKEAAAQEDRVIVVEGYMDFIVPFQAGVKPMVASLGTALTVDQIRLIRRYTRNVILLFDTDPAGQAAMLRSLDLLVEEDMNMSIVTLEDGEDPDSCVRDHGLEVFQERISHAVPMFDFKLGRLKTLHDIRTVEGKAAIADGMLETIAKYQNDVIRSGYVHQLSSAIGIPENILLSQMAKAKQGFSADRKENVYSQKSAEKLERTAEYFLLKLLLLNTRLISASRQDFELVDIQNDTIRSLMEKIYAQYAQTEDVNTAELLQECTEEAGRIVVALLAEDSIPPGEQEKMYRDCVQRIKKKRLQERRKNLIEQIREAEQAGNSQEVNKLKQVFNQLIKG